MAIADTITGYLLLGIPFLAFTIMNYRIVFMRFKKVERIPSPAPFLGGISGAMLMVCIFGFRHPLLLVLPLLIDPGSIPLIIWFFICLFTEPKK